ncbi:MAG TPA: hypothetical protein VIY28_02750 [Pseudonocardiaceae bacterium]
MDHDSPKLLFTLVCQFLISQRVMRPGAVHLLEHAATVRERARRESWWLLARQVNKPARRAELDALLVRDVSPGRTRLSWLGEGLDHVEPLTISTTLTRTGPRNRGPHTSIAIRAPAFPCRGARRCHSRGCRLALWGVGNP